MCRPELTFQAFVAFTVIAAALLYPNKAAIAVVRLVGVCIGRGTCAMRALPALSHGIFGRDSVWKHRVAWCGWRNRRSGGCSGGRLRRLSGAAVAGLEAAAGAWSGRCIRAAFRFSKVIPLHALDRSKQSALLCIGHCTLASSALSSMSFPKRLPQESLRYNWQHNGSSCWPSL